MLLGRTGEEEGYGLSDTRGSQRRDKQHNLRRNTEEVERDIYNTKQGRERGKTLSDTGQGRGR